MNQGQFSSTLGRKRGGKGGRDKFLVKKKKGERGGEFS